MKTEITNLKIAVKLYKQTIKQLERYYANPNELQTENGQTKFAEMYTLARTLEANIESQMAYITTRKPNRGEQAHIYFQLSEYTSYRNRYTNVINDRTVTTLLNKVFFNIAESTIPHTKKDNEKLIERVALATFNVAGDSRAMTTQERRDWIHATKDTVKHQLALEDIPLTVLLRYNELESNYVKIINEQTPKEIIRKEKGHAEEKGQPKDLPQNNDEMAVTTPVLPTLITEPLVDKNVSILTTHIETHEEPTTITLEEIKEVYKESQPSPIKVSEQFPPVSAIEAQNIISPASVATNQTPAIHPTDSANITSVPNDPQSTVIIEPISPRIGEGKVQSPQIASVSSLQPQAVVSLTKLPSISDALKEKIDYAINSLTTNDFGKLCNEKLDEQGQKINSLFAETIQAYENDLRSKLKDPDPVLLEKIIQSHKKAYALNLLITELAKEKSNEASAVSDSLYNYVQQKIQNDPVLKNTFTEGLREQIDTALKNRDAPLYVRAMKISSICDDERYHALGKLLGESAKDIKNSLCKTTYHDLINTDLQKNIIAIIQNTAAESSILTRLSALLMHIPYDAVNDQNIKLIKNTIASQISQNYIDTPPTYKSLHALLIGPMATFNKTDFHFNSDPFRKADEIIEKMSNDEIDRHKSNLAEFSIDVTGQLNYLLHEENKLLEITQEPEKEFPRIKSYIDNNIEALTAILKNDFDSVLKNPSVYDQLAYARKLSINLTGGFIQKSGLNEMINGVVNSFKSYDKKALVLEELKNIAASDKIEFHDKCKRINLIVSMLNLTESNKKELGEIQKSLAKKLDQALVALSKTNMPVTDELMYLRELNKTFPKNSQIMRGLSACEHILAKCLNSISMQSFKEFPFEEHLKNPEYISDAVKYVNGITNFVRNDILQYPDPHDRAIAFSNWINIATICKNSGDFQTAKAIASTFEMQQLNLPHAKSLLDKKDKDSLINLLIFVDPKYADAGYKKAEQAYTSEAHSQNAPYIPYIGSYTRGILTSIESAKNSSSTYKGEGKTWLNIPGLPSKYIAPLVQYHEQGKTAPLDTNDQNRQLQALIAKPGKPDFVFDDLRKKYEPPLSSYGNIKIDPKSNGYNVLQASKAYVAFEEEKKSAGVEANAPLKPKAQEITKPRSDSTATAKLPVSAPATFPLEMLNNLSKDKDIQTSAVILKLASKPLQAGVVQHFEDIETIMKRDITWGIQHLPDGTNTDDLNDRNDKIKGINACFYFIDQHFQAIITTLRIENPIQDVLIKAIEKEQQKYQTLHNEVKSNILKENVETILTSTGKRDTLAIGKPLTRERSPTNAVDKKDEHSLFDGLASLFTTQKPAVASGSSTATMVKSGISTQSQYPAKSAENSHSNAPRAVTQYTLQKATAAPEKPHSSYQLRATEHIKAAKAGQDSTAISTDKNMSATAPPASPDQNLLKIILSELLLSAHTRLNDHKPLK